LSWIGGSALAAAAPNNMPVAAARAASETPILFSQRANVLRPNSKLVPLIDNRRISSAY
jgi:hypothetical protein